MARWITKPVESHESPSSSYSDASSGVRVAGDTPPSPLLSSNQWPSGYDTRGCGETGRILLEGMFGKNHTHTQRCDRSAAQINAFLKTYHDRFNLRFTPPTLLNVAFTAGTTHLLTAVHHGDSKRKSEAVQRAEECVRFLRLVAVSWPAATDKADILETLVEEWVPPETSTSNANDHLIAQLQAAGSFQTQPMLIPQNNSWYQPQTPNWSFPPPTPLHQHTNSEAIDMWMRNGM